MRTGARFLPLEYAASGSMASSNGRHIVTPMPFKTVRREIVIAPFPMLGLLQVFTALKRRAEIRNPPLRIKPPPPAPPPRTGEGRFYCSLVPLARKISFYLFLILERVSRPFAPVCLLPILIGFRSP